MGVLLRETDITQIPECQSSPFYMDRYSVLYTFSRFELFLRKLMELNFIFTLNGCIQLVGIHLEQQVIPSF